MPQTSQPIETWLTYEQQMNTLNRGHALWDPAPTSGYRRIAIGDVGYIRQGRFHLLFSAGSPLGERQRGTDVPTTFEPLNVGTTNFGEPLDPTSFFTSNVQAIGVSVDVSASTSLSPQAEPSLSFRLTGDCGAVLATRYRTYSADAESKGEFRAYTRRHYKSWISFAKAMGVEDDVHPVLVTGFDVTRDFAMVAYSNDVASPEAQVTIEIPTLDPNSTSPWNISGIGYPPHINQGPRDRNPSPPRQEASPQSTNTEGIPVGFDQCIFVRYLTVQKKFFSMVSRVKRVGRRPHVRGGRGPRDPGSGGNGGGTFPGFAGPPEPSLTVNANNDQGSTEECGSMADDAYSDSNAPRLKARPNKWEVIVDYIFQNSDAVSALMRRRDLQAIHRAGRADSLSALLAEFKPYTETDSDGVGGATYQEVTPGKDVNGGWRRSALGPDTNVPQFIPQLKSSDTLGLDHLGLDVDPGHHSKWSGLAWMPKLLQGLSVPLRKTVLEVSAKDISQLNVVPWSMIGEALTDALNLQFGSLGGVKILLGRKWSPERGSLLEGGKMSHEVFQSDYCTARSLVR